MRILGEGVMPTMKPPGEIEAPELDELLKGYESRRWEPPEMIAYLEKYYRRFADARHVSDLVDYINKRWNKAFDNNDLHKQAGMRGL